MPKKYHIHVEAALPRFTPVSRFASLEIEGCLGCLKCVKRDSCFYHVYSKHNYDLNSLVDTGDSMCVSCMRCVQECKKNILSRTVNPEYERLGDDYWRPDLIAGTWSQAETGKIPVSGAGYNGPFCGPGFDQMWTDMSEIVRPTRDGIHGREYISTVIELGRRPQKLVFDEDGRMANDLPRFIELPLPIILDIPRTGKLSASARQAMAQAAKNLGTLGIATLEEAQGILRYYRGSLMVRLKKIPSDLSSLGDINAVELVYRDGVLEDAKKIKAGHPQIVVSILLPLDEKAAERTAALALAGAEIIHLQADDHGRGLGADADRFLTGPVRQVHQRLVRENIREQLTVLLSGGIGMAEHVPKAIACGVDGVGVDLPLLVALQCRLCRQCKDILECPVQMETVPVQWGAQRITNLIGSWHSQLIEVMGAMGLREVRRLRGEVGRAMFFEDLERLHFAPLFGERIPARDLALRPRDGKESAGLPASPQLSSRRFPPVADQVKPCPSRFCNALSRYLVERSSACIACGKCAEVCAYGVHRKPGGRMLRPKSNLCRGAEFCKSRKKYCAEQCPQKALRVGPNPLWKTFGDPRWTADLIVSTWIQAETGRPPEQDLEYKVGASGGGFDRMDFAFPGSAPNPALDPEKIDLRLPLNRRGDGRPEVTIGLPAYGGGMSFGSISLYTMLSRARAYQAFNTFTCTGEGGYPEELKEYDDNVITQVATGLFGVREETIQRVRIVEFKYAQGAKPGLGGHLLGDKVTKAVARMREAVEGNALFSPFPFHSVYSVEDHKKHVDWIKMINPRALISVKVSTPADVDMVAVGSYYAGAHIIHLDGSYGGTGAAPDIAKKNIAMPIEYAIPLVHNFLVKEGVREQMTLIASGGLRSAWDMAKAIALGADGVVIGTADMVALECVRCRNCESGRGCPRGIASTDPELSLTYSVDWGSQRLINLYHSYAIQLQDILWRFGMKSIRELVGRSDLLVHQDYVRKTA